MPYFSILFQWNIAGRFNMKRLIRKNIKCKCPYCGYVNLPSNNDTFHDSDKTCSHLYEVIAEGPNEYYFYFSVETKPYPYVRTEKVL